MWPSPDADILRMPFQGQVQHDSGGNGRLVTAAKRAARAQSRGRVTVLETVGRVKAMQRPRKRVPAVRGCGVKGVWE